MININTLIGKPYDKENYHCWHFIEEIIAVPTLKDVHVDTAKDDVEKYKHIFKEITTPHNYCIVLLGASHVGVWYNGNIYHNDVHGVRAETMRVIKMKYSSIKYYKVCK